MPAVSPELDARERRCIEDVLRTEELAYVAMVDSSPRETTGRIAAAQSTAGAGLPRPYVVPMNFAYESPADPRAPRGAADIDTSASDAPTSEGRLLLHTGPGRKSEALAENSRVCVSVTSQPQLKLGATPCEDGYLYRSVILEGRATLLTEEAEREQALRAIVAKYDPEASAKSFKPRVFAQTLLYAVGVETISFKERPRHE